MIARRSFFQAVGGALFASPVVTKEGDKPIEGVGVLRFPNQEYTNGRKVAQLAKEIADQIQQGAILALPNTRDHLGEYEWDFRIEGGDPSQVKIERKD